MGVSPIAIIVEPNFRVLVNGSSASQTTPHSDSRIATLVQQGQLFGCKIAKAAGSVDTNITSPSSYATQHDIYGGGGRSLLCGLQ
jgi:hypothetical protein